MWEVEDGGAHWRKGGREGEMGDVHGDHRCCIRKYRNKKRGGGIEMTEGTFMRRKGEGREGCHGDGCTSFKLAPLSCFLFDFSFALHILSYLFF